MNAVPSRPATPARRLVIILALGMCALAPVALAGTAPAPDAVPDMATITSSLSAATGLPSRWSGRIVVDPSVEGGETDWDGTVRLDPSYAVDASRFARDWVLSHEAGHTFSRGLEAGAFARLPGFEEGPVEALRRLLQRDIYVDLGYAPDEVAYAMSATARAPYDRYVELLERIRAGVGAEPLGFYRDLLATSLPARPGLLARWIRRASPRLPSAQRRALRAVASAQGPLSRWS